MHFVFVWTQTWQSFNINWHFWYRDNTSKHILYLIIFKFARPDNFKLWITAELNAEFNNSRHLIMIFCCPRNNAGSFIYCKDFFDVLFFSIYFQLYKRDCNLFMFNLRHLNILNVKQPYKNKLVHIRRSFDRPK